MSIVLFVAFLPVFGLVLIITLDLLEQLRSDMNADRKAIKLLRELAAKAVGPSTPSPQVASMLATSRKLTASSKWH
ncbi:MAG TPA: hypothetical protein V6C97_32545 [Oculatellaceae cyanobacterium]